MTSLPQIRGHSRRRPNRTCAVSGLGMRIPRGLPMRVSSNRTEAFSIITLCLGESEVQPPNREPRAASGYRKLRTENCSSPRRPAQ
jgi:hypothetical protein